MNIMIFAAGLGTRMEDLTKNMPKPLLPIAKDSKKTLLGSIVEKLDPIVRANNSSGQLVVNACFCADQVESFIDQNFPWVILSKETERLETGGGLLQAVGLLRSGDNDPILTINSDLIWKDTNLIANFIESWRANQVDLLMLFCEIPNNEFGIRRPSGFKITESGKIVAGRDFPHMYIGIQIIKPKLVKALAPKDKPSFSLSEIYKKLFCEHPCPEAAGFTTRGIVTHTEIHHLGTKQEYESFLENHH